MLYIRTNVLGDKLSKESVRKTKSGLALMLRILQTEKFTAIVLFTIHIRMLLQPKAVKQNKSEGRQIAVIIS